MKKLLLALVLLGFIGGVTISSIQAMYDIDGEYAQEWDDELQAWDEDDFE